MGTSQSREGELENSDSEDDSNGESSYADSESSFHSSGSGKVIESPRLKTSDVLNFKMSGLSLNAKEPQIPQTLQRVKLYHHVGGKGPKAQWVVSEKLVGYQFAKEGDEEESDDEDTWKGSTSGKPDYQHWCLIVGSKIRARVDDALQMQFFDEQLRADFLARGVWALKFLNSTEYQQFVQEYQNCKFENSYQMKATEENKLKVFGKDFMVWAKGEDADDSIWEDAEDHLEQQKTVRKELKNTYNEALVGGIQSLTMGALEHSFLVSNTGVVVFRNMATGMQGKGVSIRLGNGKDAPDPYSTPKKGMLIRGESNMMLLSPAKEAKQHSLGVSQLDLHTGQVVAEWKFQKDGTPLSMRDLTNDSKGAQLDGSGSTFLGLDDNRLCRWDMRLQQGVAQDISNPVLNWDEGHQFSRGTNFQCFASTGDGAIVVGSRDGKVRLYGTTSMRQAKTAFPGLGSPVTHVDVTYDGKWVLATTDAYMILISTVFKDKDGRVKTGFTGRMGNRIAAPRLLKLNPVDAHAAGKHKFSGGQFSWVTESGKQERHLVVSVGNFTVIWDFDRVKQSDHECYRHEKGLKSCYCYEVVPKDESIVESRFMNDNFHSLASPEAPLVVATPKKVSSYNL